MEQRNVWLAYLFLALGAVVPWLAEYVEKGRWPGESAGMTAELITSIFMVFLGYVAISIIRKQNLLLGDRNQQLETLARTDGLTGLYNHRSFLDALAVELKAAERRGGLLSLVFVDLDGFKELNDRYGHVEGDRILREAAQLLRATVGKWTDWVFRYGGDEFSAILPGRSGTEAARMMEPALGEFRALTEGRCSLSVGVAQWNKGVSPKDFVSAADQAMYAAKDHGGTRVEVA